MQENSKKQQKYFFDILALVVVSGLVIFPALGQERHLASREIRHAEITGLSIEPAAQPFEHILSTGLCPLCNCSIVRGRTQKCANGNR